MIVERTDDPLMASVLEKSLFGTRKMDYTWVGLYRNLENGFQGPS
jgi:hypothetical protein